VGVLRELTRSLAKSKLDRKDAGQRLACLLRFCTATGLAVATSSCLASYYLT